MEKRRKVASESEARRCIAAANKARLSLKDWGHKHGFDGRSLRAWKMNLERATPRATKELTPKSSRTRSSALQLVEFVPAATSRSAPYVVRVGTVSVEFSDDFDGATLRRIVGVLRSC